MANSEDALVITHDGAGERYTVEIEGHEAELVYMLKGNVITYIHTYVPEGTGRPRHRFAIGGAGTFRCPPHGLPRHRSLSVRRALHASPPGIRRPVG